MRFLRHCRFPARRLSHAERTRALENPSAGPRAPRVKLFGRSPPRLSREDPLTSCPKPSIPPFSQYFISHQPFGKSGYPVCRLRTSPERSKDLGQGRKRGAGGSLPGLYPSLSHNRKCLCILRIINAQRVLGADQALLSPRVHWAWPASKCHPDGARPAG